MARYVGASYSRSRAHRPRHDGAARRRQIIAPGQITEEVADYGLVGAAFILSAILVAFSTIVLWGVFLGREVSRWATVRRGGDRTTVQPPVELVEPGSVEATRPV